MSERTLTLLTPQQVESQWSELKKLLPVESYCVGELNSDDLLALVCGGRAFVLVLLEGQKLQCAGVFEVLTYPRRRVLNAIMVGGTGVKYVLQDFLAQLAQYAHKLGADALRCYVRPSMARLIKRVCPFARDVYTVTEIAL